MGSATTRKNMKKVRAKTRKSQNKSASLDIKSFNQMSSLKNVLKKNSVIMVLVYADWCGHCQRFKPEWKSLENLPSRNVPMVSIRDDMFNASPLNTMMKVEGYPTVAVINTDQNIAVNVPNREKETLSKLLSNSRNLTSPPPPGTNLQNLSNEIKIIEKAEKTPSKAKKESKKSLEERSPEKQNEENIMIDESLDEDLLNVGTIEPPAPESNSMIGGSKRKERNSAGLFDTLNSYRLADKRKRRI